MTLPRSGIEISRVGLGLAHLHLMPPHDRRALIERALELGISHLDTAPFYCDGLSERTLGSILGRRRKSVTLTTKFGLLPNPVIGSLDRLAWPLRKLRSLLRKTGIVAYPRRSYAVTTMRRALEASLRALRTDYIDIYHIHDPLPDTELSEDLIEQLLRAKSAGSIRCIGVSGAAVDEVVRRYGQVLDVIQTAESSWSEDRFVPDITHSLFSEAVRKARRGLSSEDVRQLLDSALRRRPWGAVIVQTRQLSRLTELTEFANARPYHEHQTPRKDGANGL